MQVFFIFCLIFYVGECSDVTYYVGLCYAIGSTATTVVEYLPQIVRTFRTKECGSMSFTTNWVTTLGTAVITFYMMFSTNQHWTTLLSYIVALSEHLVLCFLQLKYDYIDKCNKKMMKNKMKEKANIFRKCFKMELYQIDEYDELKTIDENSNLIVSVTEPTTDNNQDEPVDTNNVENQQTE